VALNFRRPIDTSRELMKNTYCLATALNESDALPFVIPSINRKVLSRANECVELR
jgi:hypothetical protein